MLKYKSKVGKSTETSLRLIIPKEITKILELKSGDYITWNVELTGENINIQVKKDKN